SSYPKALSMTAPRFRSAFPAGLLALCSLLAVDSQAAPYGGVIQEGPKGKKIVALVRKANKESGFTGAVLAAEKGKVIAAVAVGEVDGKPLEPTSLFEIASCTKPFTAVAVLKLAEEGKLSLDDPIAKHLPSIPEDCRAITVRHLLQHTSGIPGENFQGAGTDLAEVLPTFLAGGPRTTPGEKHEYWNQGYALLSEVIARASGKPYTAYCREAIFKPCKMESTRFTGEKAPPKVRVAVGQSTRGAPRSALDHPYGEYGFQYRGMGGIVTSLVDLWRFDRALKTGKLLKATSIAEMTTAGPGDYGLGWQVVELEEGHTVHEHTGSVRGFLASIRRDPASDGLLVVLANNDDGEPFDLVKAECEAVLEGRKTSGAAKGLDPELAKAIVGVYRDEQGRTFTVAVDGGRVTGVIDWFGPKSFGFLSPTKTADLLFDMMQGGRPQPTNVIAVERDGEGKVKALTITDLAPTLRFERAE
ncbi:MAG TPA: serine hydrolase domain-containing protein, partial [Pirellulales bacterium]